MNTFIVVIALCIVALVLYSNEKKKRQPQVLSNVPRTATTPGGSHWAQEPSFYGPVRTGVPRATGGLSSPPDLSTRGAQLHPSQGGGTF